MSKESTTMSTLSISTSSQHHSVEGAKHVSFHEKTHTIETDGTVGCAALKESKVVLLRHTTSLPLSFDSSFGRHHAHSGSDDEMLSSDSHEEEENQSPDRDEEDNRLDFHTSYKKFAPRSKVPYVTKRASM